jgi:very-short-patch-repair endonuclease
VAHRAVTAKAAGVNPLLAKLVDSGGGLLHRRDTAGMVSAHVVEHAVASGRLARPLPRTLVRPELLHDADVLLRAAVAYARGHVAVSHLSALRIWGLPVPSGGWLHLMTDDRRHLRGAVGVRVHRREDFTPEPPEVVVRQGLPVTRLESAVIDSWPLLDGDAKRAPAIAAVSGRMTTPDRLRQVADRFPRIAGRRHLMSLLDRLAAGCRSGLELWGYDQVFAGPQFVRLKWQVPVRLGSRSVYLDALDEESGVNLELDGAASHATPADRERDLRRDAALTALGFTVVRFSSARLRAEPARVRAEALAVIRAHRRRAR